jgi:hypothetical protein
VQFIFIFVPVASVFPPESCSCTWDSVRVVPACSPLDLAARRALFSIFHRRVRLVCSVLPIPMLSISAEEFSSRRGFWLLALGFLCRPHRFPLCVRSGSPAVVFPVLRAAWGLPMLELSFTRALMSVVPLESWPSLLCSQVTRFSFSVLLLSHRIKGSRFSAHCAPIVIFQACP